MQRAFKTKENSIMKRTFANRPDWPRILKKRFKLTYIEEPDFSGYLSVICIDKVREPLVIEVAGENLCLADDGFIWTQHFPKDSNYALTTMFNDRKEVVQWYFDICDGNKVSSLGIPYYDDLYLDVVLLPSEEMLLLDEDELEQALRDKDITREQYESACSEAQKLIDSISKNENKLPSNSKRHLEYILSEVGLRVDCSD
jgi:predicted RNA-binding protein associated with RNAse of E/G family